MLALNNVSMKLTSPDLIGLIGPNGAGKSTLMKLLTASLLADEGELLLDGKPLSGQEKRLKSSLGYLPQEFGLFEDLTPYHFLDYMAALKGIGPHERKNEIKRVIALTNLHEKRKARIRSLSGGQKQRVGIAQALIGSPRLLIFDEPTVGLDPAERLAFRNLFADTAKEHLVILSTHIIEDVQSVCGHIIIMREGKIQYSGGPETLTKSLRACSLEEAYMGLMARSQAL